MSRIAVVLAVAVVAGTAIVLAMPSQAPHGHLASSIQWEMDGTKNGSSAHNHRTNIDFGGSIYQEEYSALACWDDEDYQVDETPLFDLGHCYIHETNTSSPDFIFEGSGWTTDSKNRVKEAFALYSSVTSDSSNRAIGIRFDSTTNPAAAEIHISWANLPPDTLAEWDPDDQTLKFDNQLDNNWDWYFEASPSGIPNNRFHFYSIAIHEVGHVVGLRDQNDIDLQDVMEDTFPGLGSPPNLNPHWYAVALDQDTTDAVRDLYSQSKPPPAPTELTFVHECDGVYTAHWPNVASANRYELVHNKVVHSPDTGLEVVDPIDDDLYATILITGGSWWVWVRACNCDDDLCCSGWREGRPPDYPLIVKSCDPE